ncbi:PEGA domain-containing protein [Methanoculleus taiwanensis]|uniref:PEGA domain-containing protein n=1 Tax=Methanoculleus taiwanensis TaxID=1550565 RepID=UPI000FFF607E|nr:PEGA domain-containing protein [Methanoculleus taiwanensis]
MKTQNRILILVVLLLFAGGFVSAGSAAGTADVTIVSSPGGAAVTIDGSYVGMTGAGSTIPFSVSVNAGTHTVAVALPGYQPSVTTVQVNPGELRTLSITLAPSPPSGAVYVASTPGSAAVTLDGGESQTTPANFTAVAPGTHSVKITKPGFVPWSKTVTVTAGKTVTVNAILNPAPDTGTLSVTSTPPGADIYLDGTYRGHTPLTIGNVVQGGHELRLLLAGYQTWTGTASVAGGKSTSVNAVLIPTPAGTNGDVAVTSTPAGAAIYLDSTYRGTTVAGNPIDITGVSPGTHTVTLTRAGYADYVTGISVAPGQTVRVSAVMQPGAGPGEGGSIAVSSTPSGADIYLDNQYLGITPLTEAGVAAGSHTLLLKMNGYTDWSGEIQVTAGKSTEVTAGMMAVQSSQEAGGAPIMLPAVLALAAVLFLAGRTRKE